MATNPVTFLRAGDMDFDNSIDNKRIIMFKNAVQSLATKPYLRDEDLATGNGYAILLLTLIRACRSPRL